MLFLITLIFGHYLNSLCYPFPRTLHGIVQSHSSSQYRYTNKWNVVIVYDYYLPQRSPSSTSHHVVRNQNALSTFKKRSISFLSRTKVFFRSLLQQDWVNILGMIIGFLGIENVNMYACRYLLSSSSSSSSSSFQFTSIASTEKVSKTSMNLFLKWFPRRDGRVDRASTLLSTWNAISNTTQDLSIVAPIMTEKRR